LDSGSDITVQVGAVLVVVGAAGGAEVEEAGDLLLAVVGDQVNVDPVLDRAGSARRRSPRTTTERCAAPAQRGGSGNGGVVLTDSRMMSEARRCFDEVLAEAGIDAPGPAPPQRSRVPSSH
jgi:hypothetical protein